MHAQTYETTIYSPNDGMAFHFVVIPARSLDQSFAPDQWSRWMEDAGLDVHCRIMPERIAHALSATLLIEGLDDARIENLDDLVATHADVFSFSRSVVANDSLPFESSPLSGQSIAKILSASSGTTVGAGLGYFAAHGDPLLLFILVPCGMIICGAAKGLGEALQAGLKDRIYRWLKRK